ncbi:MAG: hypothetical protein Q9187_007721, partial [Circinaria calcarea]
MSSPFGARRKARIIRQHDDNEEATTNTLTADAEIPESDNSETAPVIKRPTATGSSKPKKRSSLRLSFGPGETSMVNDESATSEVFTPKKSNLSRQAIEKNALRKTLGTSLPSDSLPIRPIEERPSYSKGYLNELKSSTPSTPKRLNSPSDEEEASSNALDIASKFGTDLFFQQNSSIPTDAEIKEKKERRARLAKEQEFISLNSNPTSDEDDDDDDDSVTLRARKKEPETRLVRDDEDIAEGFDSFVEDGRISLGKKAEREQKRRHQVEMREMIEEAEATSGEGSDDSEAERRA